MTTCEICSREHMPCPRCGNRRYCGHCEYCDICPPQPYKVVDLETDESHGRYESLDEARGCVLFDRLERWAIWHDRLGRVEWCDPYDGDDDRVRQALGDAVGEKPS